MPQSKVNRRDFLKTTAVGATALTLTAASAERVLGSNERIGVAFIGTGGRCQEHIGVVTKFQKEKKGAAAIAVCDVWDGHHEVKEITGKDGKKKKEEYSQGLYPSAKRCGLSTDDKVHVTKDYRRILDLKEVDVVAI